MTPQIKHIQATLIAGKKQLMSRQNNATPFLWRGFMKEKNAFGNFIDSALFSLQIYRDRNDLKDPHAEFVKWAGVQIKDGEKFPESWETFLIPSGLYAVFTYADGPMGAENFFTEIYTQWLPQSNYALDDRPHFEIIPENYIQKAGMIKEEVWIPIKVK